MQIAGSFDTDSRYRGIHKVLVYSGQHAFTGNFDLQAKEELQRRNPASRLGVPPGQRLAVDEERLACAAGAVGPGGAGARDWYQVGKPAPEASAMNR